MVIEVVFTHVCQSCGQSKLKKKSYNALSLTVCKDMGQTVFQGVKQDDVNCGHLNPVEIFM